MLAYIKFDENHSCYGEGNDQIPWVFFPFCKSNVIADKLFPQSFQSWGGVNGKCNINENQHSTVSVSSHQRIDDRIYLEPDRLNKRFHLYVEEQAVYSFLFIIIARTNMKEAYASITPVASGAPKVGRLTKVKIP